MSKRGPEAKIQDATIKYAKDEYGALVKKNEVGKFFVSSGWPDYAIFPGKGRVFFIEFKKLGGALTTLQQHMKEGLEEKGYKVYVVDNKAYGRIVVDQECA